MLKKDLNFRKKGWNKIATILFSLLIFIFALSFLSVGEAENHSKVQQHEEKTLDLLSKIDAFTEEDKRLRMDSAKAHYNMGNIYFHKGEHEIAVREYYQAVTLMPNDSDSHYNLAFVSGEYLKDHKTALKHYQMYLYLKPDARDRPFVEKKILESKLVLRAMIDSPLEENEQAFK